MSAVASTESLHGSLASPVIAHAAAAPSLSDIEAAEQRRWMTWFGLPALIAAVFIGAVFGTGQEIYLGFAVSAIVADIGVLIWLAMSSDTNGIIGDAAASHH